MDKKDANDRTEDMSDEDIETCGTTLREYRERTFDRMLDLFHQKESAKMNNISTYVEISGLMTALASALFALVIEQIDDDTRMIASWPIVISVFIGLALYIMV